MLSFLKSIIPKPILRRLIPHYHFLLAFIAALFYRFPSKKLVVIGVTGTKGKTSTAELLNNIFEANGANTALLGTLRFKIGAHSERNLRKMTMPGRFFVQKILRDAVNAGCTHAVIEMTSEGARQFRHRFIDMDALIFTNLAPEHIESHGSYEAYREAKLSIGRALATSSKQKRLMIANSDDKEAKLFLELPGVIPVPFSGNDGAPIDSDEKHTALTFHDVRINSELPGLFNAHNIIAAAVCARAFEIPLAAIKKGIENTRIIPGRMEHVRLGQPFPVVVDYAHTPDSLRAVYDAFVGHHNVCVLGNTGGGRDKWKRSAMGAIADEHCAHVILTNEDPYDEDPLLILNEMRAGMKQKNPEVILDRRAAIAHGIMLAKETQNAALIITGKGTDPFIMGPNDTKTPWDDRTVTEEELKKVFGS